jgi:hypothetical protein
MPYPGAQVTLTAEFLSSPTGTLVDATDLTITITDPDGNVEVAATSAGIAHVSTGLYRYIWTIPANAPDGDHVVLWSGDSGTATATDLVNVLAAADTWCTVDDVALFTGKTVSDAQLAQASAAGVAHRPHLPTRPCPTRTAAASRSGAGTGSGYASACAYQCAWMLAQPDMYQRLDMDALASTGRPITLKDRASRPGPPRTPGVAAGVVAALPLPAHPHPVHRRDRPDLPERRRRGQRRL